MRLVGLCTTILYKVLGFLAEAFPKHLPREPPRCNPPEQRALRSRVSWLFYFLSNPVRIYVHTKQPSGSLFSIGLLSLFCFASSARKKRPRPVGWGCWWLPMTRRRESRARRRERTAYGVNIISTRKKKGWHSLFFPFPFYLIIIMTYY